MAEMMFDDSGASLSNGSSFEPHDGAGGSAASIGRVESGVRAGSNWPSSQAGIGWQRVHTLADISSIPPPRSGASYAVHEGRLYVYGGFGGGRGFARLDDMYRLTLAGPAGQVGAYQSCNSVGGAGAGVGLDQSGSGGITGVWERVKCEGQIPLGRENNSAVVHDGAMYMFGGYNGTEWLSDFYRFVFDSNPLLPHGVWQQVRAKPGSASPPSARFGNVGALLRTSRSGQTTVSGQVLASGQGVLSGQSFSSVANRSPDMVERLLIFGGYNGTSWLNDAHWYDFESGLWTPVSDQVGSVPSPRSCPCWAVSSDNQKLFIFGGYDGSSRLSDLYIFHARGQHWQQVSAVGSNPCGRYFGVAGFYGPSRELVIFGGYSGSERLKDLLFLDTDNFVWRQGSTPTELRGNNTGNSGAAGSAASGSSASGFAPTGRSSLVSGVVGCHFVVFGGYNGSNVLNDCYAYRLSQVEVPESTLESDIMRLALDPPDMLADVELAVESGDFVLSNRALLMSRSEFFRRLFASAMRETRQKRVTIREIKSIHTLRHILYFIATDQLPPVLIGQPVACTELMICAEMLLLDRLKALCEEVVRTAITDENAVQLLVVAAEANAVNLKELCFEYIVQHEPEIKAKNPDAFKPLISEPAIMYALLTRRNALAESRAPSIPANRNSASRLSAAPRPPSASNNQQSDNRSTGSLTNSDNGHDIS